MARCTLNREDYETAIPQLSSQMNEILDNNVVINRTVINLTEGKVSDLNSYLGYFQSLTTGYFQAIAGDVQFLSSRQAYLGQLKADIAGFGYLTAETADLRYATIQNLTAATARIGDLEADHVSVADLSAATGRISDLEADHVSVAELNAAKGRISDLEADHVSVSDLNATNADVSHLKVGDLTIGGVTVNIYDLAMAIKSDAMASGTTWYKVSATTPSAPAGFDPTTEGWSQTEPAYVAGTTNHLYSCLRVVYADDDPQGTRSYQWSDVHLIQSWEAAKSAYTYADDANTAADSAMKGLGQVEDVVGTLNWITEHSKVTTDTTPQAGKSYYIKNQDNTFTLVTDVEGKNPAQEGWYELTEAVQNYILSHLVLVDGEGLYVMSDNSEWKVRIADDGVYIIDPNDYVAASYKDSITLGKDDGSQSYIYEDYHSLRMYDKESAKYLHPTVFDETKHYSYLDAVIYNGEQYYCNRYSGFGPGEWSYGSWSPIIDSMQQPFFHVSDLRDYNGIATFEFYSDANGLYHVESNNTWYVLLGLYRSEYIPTVVSVKTEYDDVDYYGDQCIFLAISDYEGSESAVRNQWAARIKQDPSSNRLKIVVKTSDPYTKGFTFGNRYRNTKIGPMSISFGIDSEASEEGTFAEGYNTHARGRSSHAEGHGTFSNGIGSHSEGTFTHALAKGSHSEGGYTEARGEYSHAGGYYTEADYEAQTAIGKFNDNKQNNAFEIGNGTDDNNRSNAFEVDWSGNTTAGGDIEDGQGNVLSDKPDASSLATVATSGDYDDLSNKPTIPAVPDDYIISTGTTSGWSWRKWASGRMEAEKEVSIGSTWTSVAAGFYYNQVTITPPSGMLFRHGYAIPTVASNWLTGAQVQGKDSTVKLTIHRLSGSSATFTYRVVLVGVAS